MAIFESIGLVTHETANSVLLQSCERRVNLFQPLYCRSPSPTLAHTDSSETIALSIAPSNGAQPKADVNPNLPHRMHTENYLLALGLRTQTSENKACE